MSVFKKNICQFFKYILFFTFFMISFSPALLVRLTTGSIDRELAELYFDRRMQAMALFVCVALILVGLRTVRKREISFKRRIFHKIDDVEITGKDAVVYGIAFMIIGILGTVWSLFFWAKYVIPVIF